MPVRKKRIQLGILVSAETKKAIAGLARDTGKSQSQVCEGLLAKGLEFDKPFAEIINRLDAIERRLFEPANLKNMFQAFQDIVGPARAVQPVPVSDEETTRKLRDNEERIARLEAMIEALTRSKQDEG